MKSEISSVVKRYKIAGIIITIAAIIGLICALGNVQHKKDMEIKSALEEVSQRASLASELRIAVVSMDKIQMEANILTSLHKQRADYENKLKTKLEKEQKAIEKEKEDIEKSQEVLSQEALQRRVIDYQRRVNDFQRKLSETAQSIETLYQESLQKIQKDHLDPIIQGIIAKKNLSLVIDGRMARVGENTKDLDITSEVIDALNKKASTIKMPTPKGL